MRLKLHLQYDGGPFCGWQFQPGVPTVCGTLMHAFKELGVGEVEVAAAGRTDAGVHAWGQVVHVDVAKKMPLIKYLDGLNRFLPAAVRVVRVAEVEESFHARFDAKSRHYKYLLWDRRQLRPDLVGRVGHVRQEMNVSAMAQALELLGVGEMDFTSLRDAECQAKTPVCTLLYAKIVRESNGLIMVSVGADRFLHHMVRNLMGVLVEVGAGKRKPEWIQDVMVAKDRTKAGVTFAAEGLYLAEVEYPAHVELDSIG